MKTPLLLVGFALVPVSAWAQSSAPVISRTQVEAQMKANFARIDANKDGIVTRAESQAARQTVLDQQLNVAFNALDGDKDGNISRAEYLAANKRAIAAANKGGPLLDREFDGADTNKDARLTLAEALALPLRQFDAADGNKDGVLSEAERRAAANRQRQRR